MFDHLMNRRVRFADVRHQHVLPTKAVHTDAQTIIASQSMPSKSNLRHVTPKRGRLPSQNRPITPQRGHLPHQQVRPITPQRGHLPHQQMRHITPQRGQVPSQHSQSSVSNKEYLPHRQMSPRDAPAVVVQLDISAAIETSSSSTRISENLSTEPAISDTSSVTNASISEYIAAQRIEIPHSERVISSAWGQPPMLVEYSAPDVVSSCAYLRRYEATIMPSNEDNTTVSVGNHTTLEEAFSEDQISSPEVPSVNPADIASDEQSEP
uniref:thioredoxin domain-containing protein 2-like n=1 Tax=Erigeron canadensis TaxID=72917 RepID=UPI001CB8F239|nr:thioredoxin domain-containing protein 2-like [Erigeron canadensis]